MSLSIDSISEEDLYFKPIQEDSSFWRGGSYIPLIGDLVSTIQQTSLATQIQQSPDPQRVIQLLKVKNGYKQADAFRSNLGLICSVAISILCFLTGHFFNFINWGLGLIPMYLSIKLIRQEINENRSIMRFLGDSSLETAHPRLNFSIPANLQ